MKTKLDRVLESLRKKCVAKPGATEDEPWPSDKVWKVHGKMFAIYGTENGHASMKSTLDKQAVLIQLPHVSVASYVGRYGWVTVEVTDEESLELALDLIDESYELVRSKLSKKARTK